MTKPYEIEIAKTGVATATNGQQVAFTEQMLSDVAQSYNPVSFQAPLIITHDTKGIPDKKLASSPFSYGRPDYLRLVGDRLKAVFTQKIDSRIIDWFRNGNLLGISPSFYPPSHPHNPTPGRYHLRHIAALGAEPPSMKGLTPVSFSELFEAETLEFSLPPEVALDFSCGCNASPQDPAMVSLLIGLREYLIAEKDLATANQILPHSAIERAKAEAMSTNEAIARLAELEIELESEMEMMSADPEPDDVWVDDDHFAHSYQEKPTQENTMATKKRSQKQDDEDMAMLDEPLNDDTSVLDDMDDYDQFDEDEEEDDDEAPKKKAKPKSKAKPKAKKTEEDDDVDDYSETVRLRRDMERQMRILAANFAEKLESIEEEREQQAYEFAEQRADLEQQLAEQQLQTLAQQCEVESKLLEFEEAKEQSRIESISEFVDGLLESGFYPHLVGEIGLDFAETEDGEDAVWDLTDFMASLDDVQLEFAEKFIGGVADALQDSQSAIDYSETSDNDGYSSYVESDPTTVLGIKTPSGVGVSPQAQADAQALVDFAESRGYDLSNKVHFKQAYKELRSSH